ncbi:MAG: cyclic nucleotide-binding domain-containing protein [Anaerolineae bacterium]|nr:cyclic nucleotide-binding domain-containing protein [Anaerolineae bacterium]MDW8068422.1 cyclic nucleotide-binding domain-containing protein [Anaerolineae bacterium]
MLTQEEIIHILQGIRLFSGLSRPQLRRLAPLVKETTYPPGQTICVQGEPGQQYYIILKGTVRATRVDPEGRFAEVKRLRSGEAFGETSLLLGDVRDATVETVEESHLLFIDKEDFDQLLAADPSIERALRMRDDVAERRRYPRFSWLEPGEIPVKVLHRHPFTLADRLILPISISLLFLVVGGLLSLIPEREAAFRVGGLLLVFGAIFPLLSALYFSIDWLNDIYVLTNRRVVHRERVGALLIRENFSAAPLQAIQNVQILQVGPMGRLFRFGDLLIETAGAAGQVVFRDIPDPWAVQQAVLEQQARLRSLARIQQRETIRRVVRRHFLFEGEEAKAREGPSFPRYPERPGCLWVLRSLFLPSWEREGVTVTWRRHWITLLGAIGMPSVGVILLSLITVWMARIPGVPMRIVVFLYALSMFAVILWFLWRLEDWQNDFLQVTATRIVQVDRLPLFLREFRREASLEQITNVRFEQGILGKIFRYGDIVVETAAPAGTFHFQYVSRPQDVQREIFAHIEAARQRRQEEEARQRRVEMLDWLAAYDELRQPASSTSPQEGST